MLRSGVAKKGSDALLDALRATLVKFLAIACDCSVRFAGTVNLIGSGCDKAHGGRSHERLCPSGHAGNLSPGLEGLGPGGSILVGGDVVAAEVEEVVDPIVGREEALGLAG